MAAIFEQEAIRLDLERFLAGDTPRAERFLHDLAGCFENAATYDQACADGNPLVYTVSSITPGAGAGALHYGLGMIQPGRVGDEYYLTRGHLHSWRAASEVYVGLRGAGMMLLEDERDGTCRAHPLEANTVVYVPGYTAHRTVNTGAEPLVYLGIYPAEAGHDYGALKTENFKQVVVATPDGPRVRPRQG